MCDAGVELFWVFDASLSHTPGACGYGVQAGGGMYLVSGRVAISNGSAMKGNQAAGGSGSALFFGSGEVVYVLPASPGHYLLQARCEVYRAPCAVLLLNGIYVPDPVSEHALQLAPLAVLGQHL